MQEVKAYEEQEGEAAPNDLYDLAGIGRQAQGEDGVEPLDTGTTEYAFVYAGAGAGEYKLTRADDSAGVDPSVIHDVELWNTSVYMRCCSGNNWLEQYVFNSLSKQDNASDKFRIQVDVVAAAEVTNAMINEADLVYLEDGAGTYLNGSVTKTYDGSIAADAVIALVSQAVEQLKPVIVDYSIIEDSVVTQEYQDSAYQKLAKVFLKKDLASFYYAMNQSGNLVDNLLMNAGKKSDEHPDKEDNNYNYVNQNIYMVNDDTILVSEDFPTAFAKEKAERGFQEVLAAIKAENSALAKEDQIAEIVSKAMAVQYIINYSLGLVGDFRDLRILELQPTANLASDLHTTIGGSQKGTVLYWQREDREGAGEQILRSSKEITAEISTKSVAEFNGEYEDINSVYDMVFIGLDGQNLNKEGDRKPYAVYNDPDLKGKVYHCGDRAAGSDTRYDPSDITPAGKEALYCYLRAGYPVVVENDCFRNKTAKEGKSEDINTDYIAADSQMYDFLKTAMNDYKDMLYTVEDLHSSALFITQLNVVRPVLVALDTEAAESGDLTAAVRTEEGKLRGSIAYRIATDRDENAVYSGELTRRLYLDTNYDGVFSADEEYTGYLEEGIDGGTRISVDFDEVSFGLVPWKLEVADSGNGYRRDSLEGFFELIGTQQSSIRVLQILGNLDEQTANLQFLYEKADNSMMQYYLKGAEGLLHTEFQIETITPAAAAEYLAANAQYLKQWDVVVLGFGQSGNPGDTVTAAVNSYLAEGGSVVVSSAGAESDRLGVNTAALGQTEGRTYGSLGAATGALYRYSGLQGDMFQARTNLHAQQINRGSVSVFPYQINDSIAFGGSTALKAPSYLLDIGSADSVQTATTAWYTLHQSERSINAYNVSPRDARNNYYLYSRGSLVYVGQTNYPYIYDNIGKGQPDGDGMDETRLFVNALMAAYNAGIHRPEIQMVAGFDKTSAPIESITIPFDEDHTDRADGGVLDDTVEVYFRYTDNNLALLKTQVVRFYYEDPAGAAVDIGGETVQATEFASVIHTVEKNKLVEVAPTEVKQGAVYRIKAPVVALRQNDGMTNARIYVVLETAFGKSGRSYSLLSSDSISLNRAQMFMLE